MTKRRYIMLRIVISIVTMAIFLTLIIKGYGWPPFAVFAAGAGINLYLKYQQNRAIS